MSEWKITRYKSGIKHEWNGYTIVSQVSAYRWKVLQGKPSPYRDTFEYVNDAKEACEVASKGDVVEK